MSYTTRQYVTAALEEIGLAGYAYDMEPEQLLSVARRLNSMLAEWNARGIRLGASLVANPDNVDLDAVLTIPDRANEAIILGLALRVAPMFGKTPMAETKINARKAYNTMLSHYTQPIEMQPISTVAGAGNKTWRNSGDPFTTPPTDPLLAGPDSELEFY